MTAPAYLGAALCYDASHLQLYKDACLVAYERGNSWQYQNREFDCKGILMANFYTYLVEGGETNQCVCKFKNINARWVLQGHWGPCNGACVGKYKCNGNKPVKVGGNEADVEKYEAATNDTSEMDSGTGAGVSIRVGWKWVLFVATAMLFSAVA